MLVSNAIEPDQTEWESTVLLTPKKDCTLRFCISYGRLKYFTVRYYYPIPLMDEYI